MNPRNKPAADGHTFINSRGYRVVKINGCWEYVHRVEMARVLGRQLLPDEVVHHINGDKLDNDPRNLEVTTARLHSQHHNRIHAYVKVCEACGREYEPLPGNRKRQRYCGMTCRNRIYKAHPVGAAIGSLPSVVVKSIRVRVANGERQTDLAREFNISRASVNRIVRNKSYRKELP